MTIVVAMSAKAAAEKVEQRMLNVILVDAEVVLAFGAPHANFWTRISIASRMVMRVIFDTHLLINAHHFLRSLLC